MNTPKIRFKLPSRSEIACLVRSVRSDISSEYRCSDDPDDNTPGICLTIGANRKGNWSYQTGDNSYTGGAYGFGAWAVVSVCRDSNSFELADDALDQLADALHSEIEGEQWAESERNARSLMGAGLHPSQTGFARSA